MRTRLLVSTVAASAALMVVGTPAIAGSPPNPYGHSYRYCGHFKARYKIRVYAHRVSCRKAVRIQKEYWRGSRRNRVVVNGGSGALGYVLLKKFPGWKCTSGAGGGGCAKHRAVAAYQD